jgi:pyridoxine 4-dehydrogenase
MRGDDRGADSSLVLGLHRTRLSPELLQTALERSITQIDTATNYGGFTAHRTLARVAGKLLAQFSVSTKVGFFPPDRPDTGQRRLDGTVRGTVHSLDPVQLRRAVARAVDELGQVPAVVLLHNPERSLTGLSREAAWPALAEATSVLADMARRGWCAQWGIATWDADILWRVVDSAGEDAIPAPGVLMTRAGLLARSAVLDASIALAERFRIPASCRWGMSPFGGDTRDSVWEAVDPRMLLRPGQDATRWQAALRVAFDLPGAARVAVGTSDPAHLRQLATAPDLRIDSDQLDRYRRLLAISAAAADSAGTRSTPA